MPQKFEGPPYNFATIPLGTAFLAFGLGGILGKWSGGLVGDKTCSYLERKYGHRQPEHRLWALVNLSSILLGGYMLTTTVLRFLSFHLCLSAWSSLVSSLQKSSTGLDSSLEAVFSSSVFLLLLAYCKLYAFTLSLSICSFNQPDFFFCSTSSKATCLALWTPKQSSSFSSQSGVSPFLSLFITGEKTMVSLRSTLLRVLSLPALVRFSVLSSSGKVTRLGSGKVCPFLLYKWKIKGKEIIGISLLKNAIVLGGYEISAVKRSGKKIEVQFLITNVYLYVSGNGMSCLRCTSLFALSAFALSNDDIS